MTCAQDDAPSISTRHRLVELKRVHALDRPKRQCATEAPGELNPLLGVQAVRIVRERGTETFSGPFLLYIEVYFLGTMRHQHLLQLGPRRVWIRARHADERRRALRRHQV